MKDLLLSYIDLRIKELNHLSNVLDDSSYQHRKIELNRLKCVLLDDELEDTVEQLKINLHESEWN